MARKKTVKPGIPFDDIDEFNEFAPAKAEITERVKALGLDIKYPVTGDRNYILEPDGSMIMQYGQVRSSHAKWNAQEWGWFQFDCRNGLWDKLEALAAQHSTPNTGGS